MASRRVAYIDLDGDINSRGVVYTSSGCSNAAAPPQNAGARHDQLERAAEPRIGISYDEANRPLKKKGAAVNWGDDFGARGDSALGRIRSAVMVIGTDRVQAFYMNRIRRGPTSAMRRPVAPEGHGEIIAAPTRDDTRRCATK